MSEKDLVGRCGMFCGSCPMYRAGQDRDDAKIFELSFKTRCTMDLIRCKGCGTKDRFVLSRGCIFRKCANGRSLESCGLCAEFPCEALSGHYGDDMRGSGEAEKNARRVKEIGVGQWLAEADARWRCKGCGNKIALDMNACPVCKASQP
jgi:hypothetical protein